MTVVVNALLYGFALTLALAVISPLPEDASRSMRASRAVLAIGGGATVVVSIVLAILGLWFESALAGTVAIVIVGVCMWFGLSRMPSDSEDEDEDDDDGGSHRRTDPPEPTQPAGGPSEDLRTDWTDWSDFDAARAGWERDRDRDPAAI
ncbi:MAG TPA: hypothetical protein VMY78_12830 [Solirubrobacteraceae bacterium]|nr:hypothetical protein [Solirubrobacteraceae bacterium]